MWQRIPGINGSCPGALATFPRTGMHSWNRGHSGHHHFPFPISDPLALVIDLVYNIGSAIVARQLRPSAKQTHHLAHPTQRLWWHTSSSSAIFATIWCRYNDRIHHHNIISIPSSRQGAAEAIEEILSFLANGLVLPTRGFLQPSNSGVGSGAQCSRLNASDCRSRAGR